MSDMSDMSDIEKLRRAYSLATPGDWQPLMTFGDMHVCTLTENRSDVRTVAVPSDDDDAAFIALAHNLMPRLFDVVATAIKVVDCWERGDLAGAVRDLDNALKELT